MAIENPGDLNRELRPSDGAGALIVAGFSAVTALGLWLASQPSRWLWLAGQLALAVATIQWFVLLHEAGHKTLFRGRLLNALAGHLASFFCLIPFSSWQLIHGMHHKWTGWQDLDPTTAALVPRPLGRAETLLMDTCWRAWFPLFSILYRIRNFWPLLRLLRMFRKPEQRRRLSINLAALAAVYLALALWLGPLAIVKAAGLGFFLGLVFLDPLLLSQHSHIPLRLSKGEAVDPIPPLEQGVYTRSLRYPGWFSACVLLHFDAHELHHLYPAVPGYLLHRARGPVVNERHWLDYLIAAKRIPASEFLFKNRNDTGHPV